MFFRLFGRELLHRLCSVALSWHCILSYNYTTSIINTIDNNNKNNNENSVHNTVALTTVIRTKATTTITGPGCGRTKGDSEEASTEGSSCLHQAGQGLGTFGDVRGDDSLRRLETRSRVTEKRGVLMCLCMPIYPYIHTCTCPCMYVYAIPCDVGGVEKVAVENLEL